MDEPPPDQETIRTRDKELRNTKDREPVAGHKLVLGTKAGTIAHDVNNWFQGIIAILELALSDSLNGQDITQELKIAIDAAKRGIQVNQELVDFANYCTDNQAYRLKLKPVLMAEAIQKIEKALKRMVLAEKINLNFQNEKSEFCCLLDPVGFEALILNLVVNAKNAIEPKQEGRIIIRTKHIEITRQTVVAGHMFWPGHYVVLEVNDNGRGMEASFIQQMFQPFVTNKSTPTSLGLGLHSVAEFVKKCGGRIVVKSRVGVGTSIIIYFPAFVPEIYDQDQLKKIRTKVG
jgi:signal transduction histidine kinase